MELLKRIKSDPVLFVVLGLLVGQCALLVKKAEAERAEAEAWDAFAIQHRCEQVGRVEGSLDLEVGYAAGVNGKGGVVISQTIDPTRIGWKCNDGVTYWRKEK